MFEDEEGDEMCLNDARTHYPAFVSGQINVSELARIFRFSRSTVYKYLKMLG